VGIDPRWDSLPEPVKAGGDPPTAFRLFGTRVIEAVQDIAVAVKPQVAFFERYGWRGMETFEALCRLARERGIIVIGDLKRGDIGSTAEAYAEGWLGEKGVLDAMTVNPYLGADSLEPFVNVARENGRGLFVLVRTSNPSARDVQDLRAAGELAPERDRGVFEVVLRRNRRWLCGEDQTQPLYPLYRRVGELVQQWGEGDLGECGYSLLGAVVGATYPEEAGELRKALPTVPFLVPGYGAQGGSAADVAPAFDADGLGAVVNSSRGVIFAHSKEPYASQFGEERFDEAVRAAAEAARENIAVALG
jgi:orotidine-5'-phosphate decarboxylase